MAHTKYIANHVFGPTVVGVFHLATCSEAIAMESSQQRGGVVHGRLSSAGERDLPLLGYSDYREALVEQGFTPCPVCNP